MIQTKYGDLLSSKGIIVHGVNSQGVMGSGVAKQIKDKWPEAYGSYMAHNVKHKGKVGGCSWY